ncbi:MAG: hypothetical protein ACQETE_02250 [Bacteroidota bacterium]
MNKFIKIAMVASIICFVGAETKAQELDPWKGTLDDSPNQMIKSDGIKLSNTYQYRLDEDISFDNKAWRKLLNKQLHQALKMDSQQEDLMKWLIYSSKFIDNVFEFGFYYLHDAEIPRVVYNDMVYLYNGEQVEAYHQ